MYRTNVYQEKLTLSATAFFNSEKLHRIIMRIYNKIPNFDQILQQHNINKIGTNFGG